jgi:hypothetical protein
VIHREKQWERCSPMRPNAACLTPPPYSCPELQHCDGGLQIVEVRRKGVRINECRGQSKHDSKSLLQAAAFNLDEVDAHRIETRQSAVKRARRFAVRDQLVRSAPGRSRAFWKYR